MADSATFEWMCGALEAATDLDRLAARGTLRLALREAGLEAATVSAAQMHVVLQKILPGELTDRGVGAAAELCRRLEGELDRQHLGGASAGADDRSPEAVFARLGGR